MNSNSKGFSLLELLIAIMLLSFIMVAVIQATNSGFRTKKNIVEDDTEFLQIQTALARLDWDISQYYSPLFFTSFGTNRNPAIPRGKHYPYISRTSIPVAVPIHENKNSFEFLASSNRRKKTDALEASFAWIKYTLQEASSDEMDKNPLRGKYNLVRFFVPHDPYTFNENSLEESKSHIILTSVEELEFSFWNEASQRFSALKEINGDEEQILIKAVKVQLKWRNSRGILEDITSIFRPTWASFIPATGGRKQNMNVPQNNNTTNENPLADENPAIPAGGNTP